MNVQSTEVRLLHDFIKGIDDPNIAGWAFKPDISVLFEDAVFLGAIRLSDYKPTIIYPASLEHRILGPKFRSSDMRTVNEDKVYLVGSPADPLSTFMGYERKNYILGRLKNDRKTHFITYDDKRLRVRFSHDFFKHYSLEPDAVNTYSKLQK